MYFLNAHICSRYNMFAHVLLGSLSIYVYLQHINRLSTLCLWNVSTCPLHVYKCLCRHIYILFLLAWVYVVFSKIGCFACVTFFWDRGVLLTTATVVYTFLKHILYLNFWKFWSKFFNFFKFLFMFWLGTFFSIFCQRNRSKTLWIGWEITQIRNPFDLAWFHFWRPIRHPLFGDSFIYGISSL